MLTYELIYQSFRNMPAELRAQAPKPRPLTIHAAADGSYDLMIYDLIGMGCCEAAGVVEALATAGGAPVTVRINSPGGDAFEGVAIMNALETYEGRVTAQIDGVAASAASYIAIASDQLVMQPRSFLMIHNAWTISMGDKNRLQSQINALSRIDSMQVDVFAEKTDLGKDRIVAMLDQETWMTANEAFEMGFADEVLDPKQQPTSDSEMEAYTTKIDQQLQELCSEFDALLARDFALEKRRRLLAARLLATCAK